MTLPGATGKLILDILSSLAAFERENLLERQRAGIDAAKKRGVYKGRVWLKLENPQFFENCYQRYMHQKSFKLKDFMESTGLKQATLMKFLNLRKKLQQPFPTNQEVTIKVIQELIQEKERTHESKKIY